MLAEKMECPSYFISQSCGEYGHMKSEGYLGVWQYTAVRMCPSAVCIENSAELFRFQRELLSIKSVEKTIPVRLCNIAFCIYIK